MRRLVALVQGLPETAACRHPADEPRWSQEHELLATILMRQDYWFRLLARQWGAKPQNLPPAPQIDHPRWAPPPRPQITTDPAEIRQFFQQRR